MRHLLQQRAHAHLVEDRDAIVRAAAVAAQADLDARRQHIDDARHAVAEEHVAGGVVDQPHVALAHQAECRRPPASSRG